MTSTMLALVVGLGGFMTTDNIGGNYTEEAIPVGTQEEQFFNQNQTAVEPDFYQLFDQYREQGYSAEEAENLSWKVIQGRRETTVQNSQAVSADEVKPLSSGEYSAFLTGLAHYLEKLEEPGRMERSLEIIDNQFGNYYCNHCGADFSDWHRLSDEERESRMDTNLDIQPGNLPDSCPCCGISYQDDDEMY